MEMRFLTQDAANDYLELTWASWNFGIIGRTHLLARLAALAQLAEATDGTVAFARQTLARDEWPNDSEWSSGSNYTKTAEKDGVAEGSRLQRNPDGYLELMTTAGGLKDWIFHQADDDPFPSVPHGHWHPRKHPDHKLDAYLGWVYSGAEQRNRVKRWSIVELWNDEKFREFASTAIDYYLTHHPEYRGWRVLNPRQLPRRHRRW
jgi:hypothetical protein